MPLFPTPDKKAQFPRIYCAIEDSNHRHFIPTHPATQLQSTLRSLSPFRILLRPSQLSQRISSSILTHNQLIKAQDRQHVLVLLLLWGNQHQCGRVVRCVWALYRQLHRLLLIPTAHPRDAVFERINAEEAGGR